MKSNRPSFTSCLRRSDFGKLLIGLVSIVCFAGQSAQAATFTWDITPGTVGAGDSGITGGAGVWNTSNGNWTTDAGVNNVAYGNTSSDDVVFGGTAGTVTITTGTGITTNKLVFSNTGYTIAGSVAADVLTLAGTTPTIDVTNSSQTATISAVVAGTAGLVKTGLGTLVLTNTGNTLSGGITLGANAGTLTATTLSGTNISGIGSNAVSIDTGSTLNLLSANTTSTTATINNTFTGAGLLKLTFTDTNAAGSGTALTGLGSFTGTIQLANSGGNTDKLSGSISAASASLQIDSGSQLFVSANQTFGSITVIGTGNNETRGAIRVTTGNTLAGSISLLGNTTIGTEGGTISGNITSGATGTQTLTFGTSNSTGNGTMSGNIGGGTGSIAITKTAAGVLFLNGVNTYTGTTTLTAGTISLGNAAALGTSTLSITAGNLEPVR